MRPFFLCITLLAASITAIKPPAGESIPEAGTSTGPGTIPEAGTSTGPGTIPEAGTSTGPGTIPEAGPSNLEAGSDPEAKEFLYRWGKKPTQVIANKIRNQDAWWTGTKDGEGNVRPANEGEDIRGISTFNSKQAGALLFHLN
jgi:hypothetical protein